MDDARRDVPRPSSAPDVLESFARLGNVWLVVWAAALGVLVPTGDLLSPLITPLVVVLVAGSLQNLDVGDLDRGDLSVLLVSLVIAHVALPLAAALIGPSLLSGDALIGLLVVVAAPTTAGSAVIWARLGDGDVVLATVIALVTILLAPLVLPGVLAVSLARNATLSPVPVVRELAIIVGGGLALSWVLPAERVDERVFGTVSRAAIALLVYVSVSSSDLAGTTLDTLGGVAVAAMVVTGVGLVLSLAAGRLLSLAEPRTRSIFLAASLKNLGIALVVAASLGMGSAAVAITVYYVVQQIGSALFAAVQ